MVPVPRLLVQACRVTLYSEQAALTHSHKTRTDGTCEYSQTQTRMLEVLALVQINCICSIICFPHLKVANYVISMSLGCYHHLLGCLSVPVITPNPSSSNLSCSRVNGAKSASIGRGVEELPKHWKKKSRVTMAVPLLISLSLNTGRQLSSSDWLNRFQCFGASS